MKKKKGKSKEECANYLDNYCKSNIKFKFLFTLILLIYVTTILIFSWLPGSQLEGTITPNFGTLLHYLGYLILFPITLLCFYSFAIRRYIKKSIIFGIVIASITEIGQLLIPGRSGNVFDMCVNLTGLFTIPIVFLMLWEENEEEGCD